MNHRLSCYTLFDITHTGVLNRARPPENSDYSEWMYKRNTQCNFDTILQAISLRSQPEIITYPEKELVDMSYNFGNHYKLKEVLCWKFEFSVFHSSVFEDGITDLGYLYGDCEGIPMIKCGTELSSINPFLDISNEYRNIYFIKHA
jgi:hypothetical protein